jgi:hypothetical protein
VNTNNESNSYGCSCYDNGFSSYTIDCPKEDGCYNYVWYDYPDVSQIECQNGQEYVASDCSVITTVNNCTERITVQVGYAIDLSCQSVDDCPYGYVCEGNECVFQGKDSDGDGYYTIPVVTYDENGTQTTIPSDCRDYDKFVNPGATETPYNGIDDDCNPETPDNDLDGDGYMARLGFDPYYYGQDVIYDCDDRDASVYQNCTNTGEICLDLYNVTYGNN